MKIAILGAGSWGTALAHVLSVNSHPVTLWSINSEEIEGMKRTGMNERYLPGAPIGENVTYTTDLKEAVTDADVVLIAVPSQAVRSVMKNLVGLIVNSPIIVNVSKGIEITSLKCMSQVIAEFYPNLTYVVLSGPSHAEEVINDLPTTLVSASQSREACELIQDLFSNNTMRVYTNPDVVGVELGGALKNIIAIGAGMSDGMGFGDNAKAALMTRGITEIARLGKILGADENTFKGLSGIGDLIVTCTSMHSRNRRCGIMIGEGKKASEAVEAIGMVVEGFYTVKSAYDLSIKHDVDMPITKELYSILYEDHEAKQSVLNLMLRSRKHEMEEWANNDFWS